MNSKQNIKKLSKETLKKIIGGAPDYGYAGKFGNDFQNIWRKVFNNK